MECINCEGTAREVSGKRIGRYRKEIVEVESTFFRCDICKDEYFTPAQVRAHTRTVKNEVRKKYALLPPEEILRIRRKLDLSQEELEELLGTGAKVVVRWEKGKVIQSRGHDSILRLLDDNPQLLNFLRQIQEFRSREKAEYERSHRSPRGLVAQAV